MGAEFFYWQFSSYPEFLEKWEQKVEAEVDELRWDSGLGMASYLESKANVFKQDLVRNPKLRLREPDAIFFNGNNADVANVVYIDSEKRVARSAYKNANDAIDACDENHSKRDTGGYYAFFKTGTEDVGVVLCFWLPS